MKTNLTSIIAVVVAVTSLVGCGTGASPQPMDLLLSLDSNANDIRTKFNEIPGMTCTEGESEGGLTGFQCNFAATPLLIMVDERDEHPFSLLDIDKCLKVDAHANQVFGGRWFLLAAPGSDTYAFGLPDDLLGHLPAGSDFRYCL